MTFAKPDRRLAAFRVTSFAACSLEQGILAGQTRLPEGVPLRRGTPGYAMSALCQKQTHAVQQLGIRFWRSVPVTTFCCRSTRRLFGRMRLTIVGRLGKSPGARPAASSHTLG